MSTTPAYFAKINNGTVNAIFRFTANDAGNVTAIFQINGGLNNQTHEYTYHIHEKQLQVADCITAGAHFNPTNASFGTPSYPKSPSENWALFEVGDLSGKYGTFKGTPDGRFPGRNATDPTLSLNPSSPNSIVGRSIVIHGTNGTRIGCANILPKSDGARLGWSLVTVASAVAAVFLL
jgi:Cu/Zn superoxide dismutase